MRRAVQSGFTLIELLIVVGIIGLLSAVLVPQLLESKAVILARAEEGHLKKLGTFFTIYKARNKESLPVEGGHKLLLALWTSKVMNHTEENFGFFWTPESQDPVFLEKRAMVSKGEDPWPTLAGTSSDDTHYAGRAKKELRGLSNTSEQQAVAATDNEGMNCLADGTVCVLYNDFLTTKLFFAEQLIQDHGAVDPRKEPVVMVGESALIPACKKLEY
ncbi:MAG: type II secretion system protein [Planctomycetota bacterium]|jgi:prepilin-type N-terminal cleavage/methylation domain-containing protein